MKNKKIILFIAVIIIVIIVASFAKINVKEKNTTVRTSTTLNNSSIGWGIKRNNRHEQPDLGIKNKQLIDKYNGVTIGKQDDKYIYLTFDEGYEAGYTPKILDILNENDVRATFFITGHYLNSQPELVEQIIAEGHILGNHTVNHYSMPTLSEEKLKSEIMNLHTSVFEKFGYEMKYLRPPKGEYSEKSLAITQNLGYTTTMWSFAYDDWDENKQKGTDYAEDKILSNIHNGAVILLHANSKDNCEVLDKIIKKVKEDGYTFKPLDELKNN